MLSLGNSTHKRMKKKYRADVTEYHRLCLLLWQTIFTFPGMWLTDLICFKVMLFWKICKHFICAIIECSILYATHAKIFSLADEPVMSIIIRCHLIFILKQDVTRNMIILQITKLKVTYPSVILLYFFILIDILDENVR